PGGCLERGDSLRERLERLIAEGREQWDVAELLEELGFRGHGSSFVARRAASAVGETSTPSEGGPMDKVVHFESPVDGRARAKEFYGSIFDWDLNEADMGGGVTYTTVGTVETDERRLPKEPGAINGGLMDRTSQTPSPVITIQVDSIDDTLKKVDAGGGKTVQPRTEIQGM